MTTIISRLYDSANTARQAHAALRSDGFAAKDMLILARAIGDTVFDRTSAEATMHEIGVHSADTASYLDAIEDGAGLVVVRAPFGTAKAAGERLEEFGPSLTRAKHGDKYEGFQDSGLDRAAPFSSLLGLKVLSSDPAPFSRLLGLPVLSRRKASGLNHQQSGPTFNVTLFNDPAPLSRLLGLPTICHHPAPFSAALGLPVLLRERHGAITEKEFSSTDAG